MKAQARQQYLNKIRKEALHKAQNFHSPFFIDQKSETHRALDILLVEDTLSDVESFDTAMKQAGIRYNLISLGDNDSAVKYLNRESPYSEMPIPDVIVVDMCSKKINGDELLNFMKNDYTLRMIPILPTYEAVENVRSEGLEEFSYSCPMNKPFLGERMRNCLSSIKSLWHVVGYNRNLALGHG